jgi:hypothetical protein
MFTLQTLSNPNYTSFNTGVRAGANNSLVRSLAITNPRINTVNAHSGSYTIATTSAGSHLATIGSSGSRYVTLTAPNDYDNWERTIGAHTHSFSTNLFGNTLPTHVIVAAYTANGTGVALLPPNTIVFADNVTVNLGKIQANNTFNNLHIVIGNNNIGAVNTNVVGASSLSSAGAHLHATSGSTWKLTQGTAQAEQTNWNNALGNHNHSELINITPEINTNRTLLRTWVTTDFCPISNGMIFAWTTNNVPTGWYSCNGGVVNGYTTPNLVDRFIACGNSTNHGTNTNGGNILAWGAGNTATDNWTHNHGVGTTFVPVAGNSRSLYHFSASAPHFHNISANTGVAFTPRSTNLSFYIYLP